jgi:hypothetical protein
LRSPHEPSGRLQELVDLIANGIASDADFSELEVILRADAEARRFYIESMDLHASLRRSRLPAMRSSHERQATHHFGPPIVAASGGSGAFLGWSSTGVSKWVKIRQIRFRWIGGAAIAALVLIALSVRLWPGSGRFFQTDRKIPVATVLACDGGRWASTSSLPVSLGSKLSAGQFLRLEQGTAVLHFTDDARVTLEGPAELELRSPVHVRALRGKVTVQVRPQSKGFTVETPRARVVDLGTEFGLEIDHAGQTDVVVFQGAVDLSYESNRELASPRGLTRLTQGEALRLGPTGDMSRIVSVERRAADGHWSTGAATDENAVILAVGDNIRGLVSTKYYQIVPHGMNEDVPAYVDRPHQWNGLDRKGLPEALRGADYVMPFNADKRSREIEVTVTLARAATLYVFFDDRAEVPPWLAEQFTDTGWDIGLDEGLSPERVLTTGEGPGQSIDTVFSVWKRELASAGSVTLGAMIDVMSGKAMYGIAATAKNR